MPEIKPILTGEEFESLTDADEKALYKKRENDYILDVKGAVNAAKHEKENFEKYKQATDHLKVFEGLDHETVTKAMDAYNKAQDKKVIDKEGYESALKLKQDAYDKALAQANTEWETKHNTLLNSLKNETFSRHLLENGIRPETIEFAVGKFSELVDFEAKEQGFEIKSKTGIGDPKELKELTDGLKSKYTFIVPNDLNAGSGTQPGDGTVTDTSKMSTEQKLEMAFAN